MIRFIKIIIVLSFTSGFVFLFTNAAPNNAVNGTYVFSVDTSYENSSKVLVPLLQEAIDQALQQNCYGAGLRSGPEGYPCGEYPIGKRLNASTKLLEDFTVEFKEGKSLVDFDDGSVKLKNDFRMRILMDRDQKRNQADTKLLDVKKKSTLVVADGLFETMTLQHTPKGNAMYTMACTYFPGVNLRTEASDFDVDYKYKWKFLFFSGTERMSTFTKLKDGKFSVNNAKLCAILKIEVPGLEPKVTLMDISYPEINDLKVVSPIAYGTRVEIHTLGLKIANFLLKLFGIMDIEKMVSQEIEKTMQKEFDGRIKILSNDLKNGTLFEKLFAETLNKKFTRNIAAAYKKVIAKQFDDTPLRFRQSARKFCVDILEKHVDAGGLPIKPSTINGFCSTASANLEVIPFDNKAEYDKAGCYDFPYSPLPYSSPEKNGWWQNGCALSSRVSLEVSGVGGVAAMCFEKLRQSGLPLGSPEFFAGAEKCSRLAGSAILDLPEAVISNILAHDLTNVEDIKKLALEMGVSALVVNRLVQFLR